MKLFEIEHNCPKEHEQVALKRPLNSAEYKLFGDFQNPEYLWNEVSDRGLKNSKFERKIWDAINRIAREDYDRLGIEGSRTPLAQAFRITETVSQFDPKSSLDNTLQQLRSTGPSRPLSNGLRRTSDPRDLYNNPPLSLPNDRTSFEQAEKELAAEKKRLRLAEDFVEAIPTRGEVLRGASKAIAVPGVGAAAGLGFWWAGNRFNGDYNAFCNHEYPLHLDARSSGIQNNAMIELGESPQCVVGDKKTLGEILTSDHPRLAEFLDEAKSNKALANELSKPPVRPTMGKQKAMINGRPASVKMSSPVPVTASDRERHRTCQIVRELQQSFLCNSSGQSAVPGETATE